MTIGQFLQNEILKMQWLERLTEKVVALTGLNTSGRIGGSVTFSFLISSPMVDIGSLIILMSIFGWKVAVTYVILGLVIAIIGGRIGALIHNWIPEAWISQVQGVMKKIKVLGTGCSSCHKMYENVKKAVGEDADVEYITDLETIIQYGVMTMPALVADEKVVSSGKVLKPNEIKKLLLSL